MGICGGSVDRRLMSSALQKVPGPPWGFFDKDVEGNRVKVLEGRTQVFPAVAVSVLRHVTCVLFGGGMSRRR